MIEMKKNEANRISVKRVSSKEYKGNLKEDLKANRFLPSVGQTFKVRSVELLLVDCEPREASYTGPNTYIELIDEVKVSKDLSDKEKRCVLDFLIPELLGKRQKLILKVLDKKLDGEEINTPSVIFLLGPSSTSKTKILSALARKAESKGWKVVSTDGPTLMGMHIGDTADYFKAIRKSVDAKTILLIDEVDSICGKRVMAAGGGGGFTHLLETVTSLNKTLDKVMEEDGIAILASNIADIAIDDAILNRSLIVKRGPISKETLDIAVDIFGKKYKLSKDIRKDIRKMELKSFRDIILVARLRSCGLSHDEARTFLADDKKEVSKDLVYLR